MEQHHPDKPTPRAAPPHAEANRGPAELRKGLSQKQDVRPRGIQPGRATTRPREQSSRQKGRPNDTSSSMKKATPTKHHAETNVVDAWRAIFRIDKQRPRRDTRHVRHKSERSSTVLSPAHGSVSPAGPGPAPDGSPTKLCKNDLGRHANEKQMPDWLVQLLKKDGEICGIDIIPVIQQLLDGSSTTRLAYLCSPDVLHISKLRREGSFCGYRNIQMLISYIINSQSNGSRLFGETFPSIFQIQDLIENAWDNGFNEQGRIETGGIKGTRKYIGTPEAQAMFSGLQITCPVQAFRHKEAGQARRALFRSVEAYFKQGSGASKTKVHATRLPPIYFQHRGHSMTIVGFERMKSGQENLLVFDPSYRDSSTIRELVGRTVRYPEPRTDSILRQYRRGDKYLNKYKEFEILCLTETAPPA